MKINSISNDNVSVVNNKTFKAKGQESRIIVEGNVDDYVQSMLDKYNQAIENNAEAYKTNVKIAQKKYKLPKSEKEINALYVNSGTITSRLDLNDMKQARTFYDVILKNIRSNSEVPNKSLGKVLKRLA